ncbi:MAG: patatin-like phospholipase family protein [Burkholderiaceae bacterium]
MRHPASPYCPPVALALQGGVSLGFFGWGMLDGLLASPRVRLDALCGSHTGAINAVLVAEAMSVGNESTAMHKLETFWRGYAELLAAPAGQVAGHAQSQAEVQARLHQLFIDTIDFARLQRYSPVDLLLSASRVRDGQQRIFRSHEISADVLSACISLPLEHPPVAIDGELYWDGGYGASLPLRQVVMETRADDVLVLQDDSGDDRDLPPSGPGLTRLISRRGLGAALQREIEAIEEMVQICRDEGLSHSRRSRKLQRLKLHPIAQGPAAGGADDASSSAWLQPMQLRDQGREAAERWLAQRPQPRMPQRQAPRLERRRAVHA